MKIITLSIRCFLFFILCTLSMADVVSQSFTMEPSFDNNVSNNSLIAKHHSESLSVCSATCGERCVCFGFNPQLKNCRIHQSCDSSEMTVSEAGWRYFCADDMAVDCRELHKRGQSRSGVYQINPTGKHCHAIRVYCDMVTSGGGWTAIQRRTSGSVDFNRLWKDYKLGFGNPADYWIGNEIIHQLTKGGNSSLYVSITLQDDRTLYELYEQFYLTDEADKYRLIVDGSATGTLGDSLGKAPFNKRAAGKRFSTPDQDNDSGSGHCAAYYMGGWWYNNCFDTNLNRPWNLGIEWHPVLPFNTKVKETLMMIKSS